MATLNLGNLTKYTDQLSGILLKESVLVGTTFDYISIQSGVKYADSINILTNSLTAAAGGCGTISPAGSTTLSQRSISVSPIKVEESICVDEFEQYWIGQLAKEGSYNEFAPEAFNQLYLANKVEKIGQLVEDMFWKASPSVRALIPGSGSGNLALASGILDTLLYTSATSSTVGATATGALTLATALNVVDNMIAQVPNDVLATEDLTLFMSHANFRVLMNALRQGNYFVQYDGQKSHTWVLDNYTNTNVRIVATRGLNATDIMVLTPSSNLYFGTDSFGEARNGDGFQFWYDIRDNITYFRAKLKVGAQVAFPQYVVIKSA
jgi:hypothetical protein